MKLVVGKLLEQYPSVHDCKYSKHNELKTISLDNKATIKSIQKNIDRLNTELDKRMNKITEIDSVRVSSTTIEPFKSKEYQRCCACEEFFKSGFQIDGSFYCKKCAAKDFKKYLNKSK